MQPAHVVVAVPDAQPLPRRQVPAHPEVDVLSVLEGRQVPLAVIRRVAHVPAPDAAVRSAEFTPPPPPPSFSDATGRV